MKKNNNNLMRVVSLVFAIVITLTLYLTETLPFSLLKPQAEASETADASPQANKEPVSDTESPVTGGKKLAIVVFDSFDKTMEEKTANILKMLEDSSLRYPAGEREREHVSMT